MHRTWGTRAPFRRDQRGVSPVVGSILILVIMIISIGGIMTWGVPAIEGLQTRAEYQAVLTQFLQMQSDVRGLRDPQNTRISQISMNDGELRFDTGSRWVFTGITDEAYDDLFLVGWEDGSMTGPDLTFGGTVMPDFATLKMTVDQFTGGSPTSIYSCSTTTTACGALLGLDVNPSDGTRDVDLAALDTVLRVQIYEDPSATPVMESWILNTGHVSYKQRDPTDRNNRLHFEMGAVFSQHGDYYYVEQTPTVKDPDYELDPIDKSLFVRVMQLSGDDPQGMGGRGSYPIVYHLVDNYGTARGRPSFPEAYGARIQVHGELEVPFCNYFEDRFDTASGIGWVFEPVGSDCPTDPTAWETADVNLRYDEVDEDLIFDLSHSVVTIRIRDN